MKNDVIFSALKKCNQIGKRLSDDGKYILVSGMMLKYSVNPYEDQIASNISIAFIENSLLMKLGPLAYVGIEIDGNKLYNLSQMGDFISFEIDQNNIYMLFNIEKEFTNFNERFVYLAKEKFGLSEDKIEYLISTKFESDIDMYSYYSEEKKKFNANKQTISVTERMVCPIIKQDNFNVYKINNVIDNISLGNLKSYKRLKLDECLNICDSTRPVDLKFEINNSDPIYFRIMKSIFKIVPKDDATLKIVEYNKLKYLIIDFNLPNVLLVNIYKIF